jgi:hypothetical protein
LLWSCVVWAEFRFISIPRCSNGTRRNISECCTAQRCMGRDAVCDTWFRTGHKERQCIPDNWADSLQPTRDSQSVLNHVAKSGFCICSGRIKHSNSKACHAERRRFEVAMLPLQFLASKIILGRFTLQPPYVTSVHGQLHPMTSTKCISNASMRLGNTVDTHLSPRLVLNYWIHWGLYLVCVKDNLSSPWKTQISTTRNTFSTKIKTLESEVVTVCTTCFNKQ